MIGTMLGKYRIEAQIRRGGMGTVCRAVDTESGRIVALKVLDRSATADRAVLQRFRREVTALQQVHHPYVVGIYDVGCEGDLHYYAMEYLEESLADRLREGPLDCLRALEIAGQVARGLQAVHAAQIVHRDVKPSNILFAPDGSAKIGDFGIARVIEGTRMTRTGAILGTPTYMAPEQAEQPNVDVRADIYSLGIVLYEMLTGRPPFEAPTALNVLQQHRFALPEDPRALNPLLPGSVCSLVLSMLEKNPAKRPASMGLLANSIEGIRRWVAGMGKPKRPTTGYHDRSATRRADQLERSAARVLRWAKRIGAGAGVLLAGLLAYHLAAYLLKRPADYLAEAQALEETEDIAAAIETYEALVQRFPDAVETPTARVRIHVLSQIKKARDEAHQQGQPLASGGLDRLPRIKMAYEHFRRARELAEAGRVEDAERVFRIVRDSYADTPWSQLARQWLEELAKLKPDAPRPTTRSAPEDRAPTPRRGAKTPAPKGEKGPAAPGP